MCRWNRGEKLSAWRFIQGYCLDRFLELTEMDQIPQAGHEDPYNRERRFEARYPESAHHLASFLPGYNQVPQSTLAILAWAEEHGTVNQALARQIRGLCEYALT